MNFFRGRYGNDQLGWFLFVASLIIEIIGRITGLRFIYYIGVLCFVLMFARMLSRNIYKRQDENQKYLQIRNRFLNWRYFRKQKKQGAYTYNQQERNRNGKNGTVYCYYYCPQCKQQVRIPAGKGNVRVRCPRCGDVFDAVS